jgi:hypothetical protein
MLKSRVATRATRKADCQSYQGYYQTYFHCLLLGVLNCLPPNDLLRVVSAAGTPADLPSITLTD